MSIIKKHWLYYACTLVMGNFAFYLLYACSHCGNAYLPFAVAALVYEGVNIYHIASRSIHFSPYGIMLQAALPFLVLLLVSGSALVTLITGIVAVLISVIFEFLYYMGRFRISIYILLRGLCTYLLVITIAVVHIAAMDSPAPNVMEPIQPSYTHAISI